MGDEVQAAAEPTQDFKVPDDAMIVHDDMDTDAEKAYAEDTERIRKILASVEEPEDETKTPEPDVEEPKPPVEEVADETPVEMPQADKDRAIKAGLSEGLAERLYQAGLLEESLASHYAKLTDAIDYDPDAEVTPEPKVEPVEKAEVKPDPVVDGELEPLDPDLYGDLSEREVLLRKQLTATQNEVAELKKLATSIVGEREGQLDEWFDAQVDSLGQKELFGEGGVLPADSPERANREKLFTRYVKTCMATGTDHLSRDRAALEIAFPAEFRNEIFKAGQKQVVQFVRDQAGKFMSPAKTSGAATAMKGKPLSSEEAYKEDLDKVKEILGRTS
jgi:hypothetical protein